MRWSSAGDIFGLDRIFAQLILALGAALLIGNGWALWRHRRGHGPPADGGALRAGRVVFLLAVGMVMVLWSLLTILAAG